MGDKSTYTSYPEYFTVVMANEMDEKTAALGAKLQKLKSSYRKGEFAVPVPSMWGKAALAPKDMQFEEDGETGEITVLANGKTSIDQGDARKVACPPLSSATR